MALSRMVYALALIKLAVHVAFFQGYGIFRDEMYYLACGRHLDWGYVDHPPLVPLLARVVTGLFGESLFWIRIQPAIWGALLVILAGMLARELGGGRWAQALAALCVLVTPMWLAIDHTLQTNALEPLLWMGCAWVFLRIVNTRNQKLWIWFGVLCGLGLQNKHSMLFFGFSFVVSLGLARAWWVFRSKWLYVAGAIAGVIFLPHVIWQITHHFPTAEFLHNAAAYKNTVLGPLAFLREQILPMNPVTLPFWVAGLLALLLRDSWKEYRIWGWFYVVLYITFNVLHGKNYYLTPAYPILFAAGGVVFEKYRFKPAWAAALAISGVVLAPLALPVLPPQTFIGYAAALGVKDTPQERHQMGPLPQFYADMFGWREMVDRVHDAYRTLSLEERSQVCIVGQNYGEAGAVDYFGPALGLPRGYSGHNNYWYWPPQQACQVAIVIGGRAEDHRRVYQDATAAGEVYHPYAIPFENHQTVWILRRPLVDLRTVWPRLKHFI